MEELCDPKDEGVEENIEGGGGEKEGVVEVDRNRVMPSTYDVEWNIPLIGVPMGMPIAKVRAKNTDERSECLGGGEGGGSTK